MKSQRYFIPERKRLEALFHREGVVASPALLKRAAAHLTLVSAKAVGARRSGVDLGGASGAGIAQRMAEGVGAKALSIFDEEGLLLSEYPQGGGIQSRLQGMHCLWPSGWKSLVVETAADEFLYWVAGGKLKKRWLVGLLAQERLAAEQMECLRSKLCVFQGE
ncbi:MAG: hypothetical protein FWC28_06070 [Proteobacteria bacterium]|nr:hypothetical protein [Cystobacterineae bacterium]MCL2258822.1 hypothetical protein [Cystobacterineae bacterium]MCL2314799.1 hypothetical protein [Pseudomonadota bacterium]